MEFKKPVRLARQVIYQNFWLNLYRDRVQLASGTILEQYHILDFERTSVAMVMENSRHEIMMVRLYRYPTDKIQWEVPAGNLEPGEEILAGAQRELLEETGYQSVDHRLVYSFYPFNGMSNKIFHIVACRAVETGVVEHSDKDEIIEHRWFSPQQLREMIKSRAIEDGYTLTALLMHFCQL